jgi:hypothetical protein
VSTQKKRRLRSQANKTYDIKLSFAGVDQAGNEGVAIRGFVPPSEETIPADPLTPPAVAPIAIDTTSELLFNYQVVGAVPYEYDIGQFEITAAQYCAFLNAVDPEGANPKQPWTKVKLWNEKNNPLVNHFQGQILYVDYAKEGQHYAVADPVWAEKPVMMINGFQFAYFVNSLVNGGAIGQRQEKRKSPLGFDVEVTDRYYKFSETIDTGSYDLNDSNYEFLARQNVDGLFFPSQDEWIKAAYYAGEETGNGTNYFYFPTVSNEAPIPLFTQEGKNQDLAQGGAADSPFAQVNVSDKGEVQIEELETKIQKNQGYSNYDFGVFWQPWYAPEGKTYGNANVTDVGGSDSPSPWLAYDMGGNVVEYTDTVAGALDIPDQSENLQKLPVAFRAHGGIANATGYQLWITATGVGDPYGQVIGSAYEYGGARLSFLGDDNSKKSAKNLRLSSRADVITGQNVVTRADSISTLDTHYSSSLGETIALLAEEEAGYVSMSSSFFNVPKKDGGRNYFSLTHDATGTSRIVRGKRLAMDITEGGGYTDPVKAFRALPPMQGDVQFIGYLNPDTGAYGYSELEADAVRWTELGYVSQGAIWSV